MYIAVEDEEIAPRHFAVCDFYDVETCFCWDDDKLIFFPYVKDGSARKARILATPDPIRKILFFNSRAFLVCTPQGAYKLSQSGEFALLSKNALGIAGEFYQVLVAWSNGVHLDDKQVKSSTLLFSLVPNASETVCTFTLNLVNTEPQLISCFAAGWETEGNLCVIAYHKNLYVLRDNTVQLVYTSDVAIVDILPAKRRDKVTGLLLLTKHANFVILVHGKDDKLVFEKIHLGENMWDRVAICASFSSHMENILWLLCCNQSRLHYIRKELFVDAVQEARVEEKTFICMQYYKSNVILALSQKKELIEFSIEEDSLSINNDIILHTRMFERADVIMEKICINVKELNILYESLTDEQEKLKRINLYAAKQKLQINPCIEVFRLCKHCYLSLSIPKSNKLPKNSYVVFTFTSKNQNTFCIKKVTETALAIKMSINENQILCSSSINMDLITLMNEQRPWCLIQNFVNYPPQDLKRRRGPKKDKTAFINAKIATLQHLIEKRELNMTKLCEIKRTIRAEL